DPTSHLARTRPLTGRGVDDTRRWGRWRRPPLLPRVSHGGGAAGEEGLELGLVEDPEAELAGLGLLGAGAGADDDVVGLLGDRAGGLAATGEDGLLGAVAGEVLERAGDDDRQALEGALDGLVALVLHADARGRPAADDLGVPVDGEPLDDGLGDRGADAVDGAELLDGGGADGVHRAEVAGEGAGGGGTAVADRERDEHPPQRLRLRLLELAEQRLGGGGGARLAVLALAAGGPEVGLQLELAVAGVLAALAAPHLDVAQRLGGEVEQAALVAQHRGLRLGGGVVGPAVLGVGQRDRGLPAERLDVARAPAREREHALAQLRRAGAGVRAADVDVALLGGRERGAAGRALGRHDELALGAVTQLDDGPDDLGDDVAGLAQHHGVADEHALALDLA